MPKNEHDAVFVGNDVLLIECARRWRERGHAVSRVVTEAKKVSMWAQAEGISVCTSAEAAWEDRESTDFLFSISYLDVLPREAISLATEGAINFHDGPLPRYAGLNTPVWALINRENKYGITWHLLESQIDAGDIVCQRLFDLEPGDTAVSVNTKCFQAAIDGFEELLDRLERGELERRAQDQTQRSYYRKYQRPPAACVIDWTRSAKEIEALVRALDFGRYRNPVGVAKLVKQGKAFCVRKARIGADENDASPGTVIAVEPAEITVATGDGLLAIQSVSTLEGREVSLDDLATELRLTPGARLDLLSPEMHEELTGYAESLARSEEFWAQRLHELSPLDARALFPERAGGRLTNTSARSLPIAVPRSFAEAFTNLGLAEALSGAIGAYLSRLCNEHEFDIGFVGDALRRQSARFDAFTTPVVPLHFRFAPDQRFDTFMNSLIWELDQVRTHQTWLRDLVSRVSDLHGRVDLTRRSVCPIVISVQEPGETLHLADADLAFAITDDFEACHCIFNSSIFDSAAVVALVARLEAFLAQIASQPDAPISALNLLPDAEREKLICEWNQTEVDVPQDVCVHQLIEEQARKSPSAVAVVVDEREFTYEQLDERANELAAYLAHRGVGPESIVGICLERSIDALVSIIGIHKAGGCYLPLDPSLPRDRIAFVLKDSQASLVLTHEALRSTLPDGEFELVSIDAEWDEIRATEVPPVAALPVGANAAYVTYTSGSTGSPKGVVVEHRNVVNFFVAMDRCIGNDAGGVWLAVTNLSFDISVLELLWTLARGFKIVLYSGSESHRPRKRKTTAASVALSLYYFSSHEGADDRRYRLLHEGAKFADEHGFEAVWTPERHFHAFGGLYPNPAVTSAALATITQRVHLRAGSVVLPLHHPIRVAEDWAVVDNLSGGRVGISFASGWQPADFVLAPENYADAKEIMFRNIELVQRLWRGETVNFPGPKGDVSVRTLPRPTQSELPTWVTTAGNIDTYRRAGETGAFVLTHLLGQSIEELIPKIQAYREARQNHGYDPSTGRVTLMLHTFVGDSDAEARELVRGPLKEYLGSSLNLIKKYAWAFPTFKKPQDSEAAPEDEFEKLTDADHEAILEHAFERYYTSSGLLGDVGHCLDRVEELGAAGVDEIACLVDFGVGESDVLRALPRLDAVRQRGQAGRADGPSGHSSIADLMRRHRVTHFQCTPSMIRILMQDPDARASFGGLKHLLLGGEAFPEDLLGELRTVVGGRITNMYGPTETTVWSSVHDVGPDAERVPIGRPVANTKLYVLNGELEPVPVGVPGELYIGGAGVTRGYLHQPELTAQRFLEDPFDTNSGRIYRTGDLVRVGPDGVVEFLGRTDYQVKIRGHRVELEEIEAQLGRHPSVKTAAVVIRQVGADDSSLVAFLECPTTPPATKELRTFLRRELPDYMCPSRFAFVDSMPLTTNGKIDRKGLPDLSEVRTATREVELVAPANDTESSLAQIWQDLLEIPAVSVRENFFDLGGNSLLVVRLQRELESRLGLKCSLTDLYRHPTIHSFAASLAGEPRESLATDAGRGKRRREALQRRRRGKQGAQ